MKIVGIGHKKGSGKDTFANFLLTHLRCERPDLKVKKVSFATKLKDLAYQLYSHFGLKQGIYYESNRREKEIPLGVIDLSPRDIWIQIGNKIREVYEYTWLDYVLEGINADILIIPDLRFVNEAKAIKQKDGILFKIIRNGQPQGTDPAEVNLDNWTDWDKKIKNNGSLNDLNDVAILYGCEYFGVCE